MAEVQYNFQSAVWDYTYSSGPDAGVVRFQSPQRLWSNKRKSIVLRQVNGEAENEVWVNRDASLVRRCHEANGGATDFPTLADAHGLLVQDGWAVPAEWAGRLPEDGAPLVPYHRGERVWIERAVGPSEAGDMIPVISIDTLQHFTISSRYICFVPQLVRRGAAGDDDHYATPAGPVHRTAEGGCQYLTQAFFEWPAGQPEKATWRFDRWKAARGEKSSALEETFEPLKDVEERRGLFRQHWAILSDRLSVALDDDVESDDFHMVDPYDHLCSSSDSSEDTLDRHLAMCSEVHRRPIIQLRSRPF